MNQRGPLGCLEVPVAGQQQHEVQLRKYQICRIRMLQGQRQPAQGTLKSLVSHYER